MESIWGTTSKGNYRAEPGQVWGFQLCVPDFGMARLMASTWILELKPSHTCLGFLGHSVSFSFPLAISCSTLLLSASRALHPFLISYFALCFFHCTPPHAHLPLCLFTSPARAFACHSCSKVVARCVVKSLLAMTVLVMLISCSSL